MCGIWKQGYSVKLYLMRGFMFEINLRRDFDYHTQINNRLIPMASCNTTAAIMALKAADINFNCPEGMQPEDALTQRL